MGISDKVKDLLSSGVSPDKLSLSMAFGVTCGIFPVPGLTTVPVLLVIFLFSLNAPGTMIVNYAMTPLDRMLSNRVAAGELQHLGGTKRGPVEASAVPEWGTDAFAYTGGVGEA